MTVKPVKPKVKKTTTVKKVTAKKPKKETNVTSEIYWNEALLKTVPRDLTESEARVLFEESLSESCTYESEVVGTVTKHKFVQHTGKNG